MHVKDHVSFRLIIEQVSLLFKFDGGKIQQRLKDYEAKKLVQADYVPSYSEQSLKHFRVQKGVLQDTLHLPLIVIAEHTPVELNDCYLRSIKKPFNMIDE